MPLIPVQEFKKSFPTYCTYVLAQKIKRYLISHWLIKDVPFYVVNFVKDDGAEFQYLCKKFHSLAKQKEVFLLVLKLKHFNQLLN